MVLTGSCGPTSVLAVHRINKKSGSLGLKNQFSSQFPVFTVWPLGPVRSGSKNQGKYLAIIEGPLQTFFSHVKPK